MTVLVRGALPQDEAQWRRLWQAYNAFYKTMVPPEATDATWQRIMDGQSAIGCIVADETGRLAGFINYVIHPRTWSALDACYMEDLYVDEAARGKGIARSLWATLVRICREKGLSQIYWNTQEGNHAARAFYDQIGEKDDFVRYVTPLP